MAQFLEAMGSQPEREDGSAAKNSQEPLDKEDWISLSSFRRREGPAQEHLRTMPKPERLPLPALAGFFVLLTSPGPCLGQYREAPEAVTCV